MFEHLIIRNCISESIVDGAKSFVIYPYGENGIRTDEILKTYFSVNIKQIVDNKKAEQDSKFLNMEQFREKYDGYSYVILTVENPELNAQMNDELKECVLEDHIINLLAYQKKNVYGLKEKLKKHLCLESILPKYCVDNVKQNFDDNGKIKIRIVHAHYPTWNVIKTVCEEILMDVDCDLKLIIGWNKDKRCIEQAQKYGISYELWDQYDAKYDQPDVLVVSQPYDYVTQILDVHKYAKLVIVASVLLIRNTAKMEWFWTVQEKGFLRFNPDYYLCDSMLYNEIKGTNPFPIQIVEMGNAKYDGIYYKSQEKNFPTEWAKIRGKKIILWTTDHGFYPDRVIGVTFDLYAKVMLEYIISHPEIGVLFRPHPVLLDELINEGYWTGRDLEEFKQWCNDSSNIIFDESETYDNAYSVADAVIADAICGITVSALPTLKPICVTYRTKEDIPYHPELVNNYYAAHDPIELIEYLEMICKGQDPMYEQRKAASEKFVKNFDGKNGWRIKEFIKEKYYEKLREEEI